MCTYACVHTVHAGMCVCVSTHGDQRDVGFPGTGASHFRAALCVLETKLGSSAGAASAGKWLPKNNHATIATITPAGTSCLAVLS